MAIETTPVEIQMTFRHIESASAVRDYALKKLGKAVHSLPNLRAASVEITFEDTRPLEQRYVVQVTLEANGTLLRVEDRGPDATTTIDRVHDLLDRRIKDWKGRVYFTRRREIAAREEVARMEATALPPEDRSGLIVRAKSYETKPMLPEDAVEQMELLGHDFYFFLNADTGQHNVIYRRKAGGYGLIEPAIRELPRTTGADNGGQTQG
ncbi:MAG: HPF/RaiA family ribosome-associated protein [Chloroflexi bacterium]|nr:HPF/RaiA family ribosome-associated protein [Chloroflexota bacterium]